MLGVAGTNRTGRGRASQVGWGVAQENASHRTRAIGAAPIGAPGVRNGILDASIERVRMV